MSAMDSGLSCELCLSSESAKVVSRWQWRFQLLLRGSEAASSILLTAPWIQQGLALNSTAQQTLPTLPHREEAA